MADRVTNATFAERDAQFRAACRAAQIEPTTRQAAKWRRGEGLAFQRTA